VCYIHREAGSPENLLRAEWNVGSSDIAFISEQLQVELAGALVRNQHIGNNVLLRMLKVSPKSCCCPSLNPEGSAASKSSHYFWRFFQSALKAGEIGKEEEKNPQTVKAEVSNSRNSLVRG